MSDLQSTNDNLNPADTASSSLILKRKRESVYLEECSTLLQKQDVTGDTIWGGFNWGAANWDGTYTGAFGSFQIVNPNNIFREYLRMNNFIDSGSSTMTISTATYTLTATTSQIFQSTPCFLNAGTLISANLYITTDNITNTARFTYHLSADGGTSWETATLGNSLTFANQGSSLKYRITATGGTGQIVIEDSQNIAHPIQVSYAITGTAN